MSHRPLRRLLLTLVLLGVVAAASVGVSRGIASSQRPTAPTETIQQCQTKLASLQARRNSFRNLRQDVVKKRSYLYTVGRVAGKNLFAPISVSEFKHFLALELLAGGISSRELVQLVREIREMTAENLRQLEKYISVLNADVQKQTRRCDALKPAQAGSFVLVENLTEVIGTPKAPELTINAAAGTATWDHTGPYGGAGKGGEWKVAYTFKVPRTVVPGKSFPFSIGLEISNVAPEQPLSIGIGAYAPDFAQSVNANYPNPKESSKTFDVPLSAGYKDFKEIVVIVRFVSAEVRYHYRPSG